MKARRIDISLFDDELKTLISASTKIFPMNWEDISANHNPHDYEYVKCLDTEHKHEIYTWDIDHWTLIGADDFDVAWDDVSEKPTAFSPIPHTHTRTEVTDFSHTHPKSEINDFGHTHTKEDISDFTHSHSTSEISDFEHFHTKEEITDFNHTHTKTDVTDFEHNHEISEVTGLTTALFNKSDLDHDHDGRYATPAQLANKSDVTHNHDAAYSSITHNHDAAYAAKNHSEDASIHVTPQEKEEWNSKTPFKYEQEFLELRDHFGYMPINGGEFDGNDGFYLMFDGGMF